MRHIWPSRRHARVPGRSRTQRLQLEVLEDRTLLSAYIVDRVTDTGAGSDLAGDLRYCITRATSGQDTITFGVRGTINLTKALPDLTESVTIEGPAPDQLTVRRDTDDQYRIFTVNTGAMVNLAGLTIANGCYPAGPTPARTQSRLHQHYGWDQCPS